MKTGIIFLMLVFKAESQDLQEFKLSLIDFDKKRCDKIKSRIDFRGLFCENLALEKQLSKQYSFSASSIPPFFHYVWVGGPLYEEYWKSITRLAILLKRACSPYQIIVWVDNEKNLHFLKSKLNRKEERTKKINEWFLMYQPILKIRLLSELYEHRPDFFTLFQHQEYWNIINYEMHGLKNLAAASDLIRLAALWKYGGVYLDTDVSPLFHRIHGLVQEVKTQLGFQIITNNNSLILSISKHPLIRCAMAKSLIRYLDHYRNIQKKRQTSQPLKRWDENFKIWIPNPDNMRFNLTLKVSGPGVFSEIFRWNPSFLQVEGSSETSKMFLPILRQSLIPTLFFGGISDKKFYSIIEDLIAKNPENSYSLRIKKILEKKSLLFLDAVPKSQLRTYSFLIHVLKLIKDSVLYPSLDVALFQDLIRLLDPILKKVLEDSDETTETKDKWALKLKSHFNKINGLSKETIVPISEVDFLKKTAEFILYYLYELMISPFSKMNRPSNCLDPSQTLVVNVLGELNFQYDCHNTWVEKSLYYPFTDEEPVHDRRILL